MDSHRPEGGRRNIVLLRLSELGASAQAAIPGFYAWAVTVAPPAWSRGAPLAAKIAAIGAVLALAAAPLVEASERARAPRSPVTPSRGVLQTLSGGSRARALSVWGFVLPSALVWVVVPAALSWVRVDGVRGVLGVVGWTLFAFASAGPSLRADPDVATRIVAGSSLKPRSELPKGDGMYVTAGVLVALGMQSVGWAVPSPERAVLVRLVTIVSGVAVLGATTSIGLARHSVRTPASRTLRLRRALPWVLILALFVASGIVVTTR